MRRRFGGLGALSGDSLAQANAVINALSDRWSVLQRDVAEAVARGDAQRALLAEVDAIHTEIDALTAQVFEIEPVDIAPWLAWSQDIRQRLTALETRSRAALENVRRIRSVKVGLGFAAALAVAAGVGYYVYQNRRKG